MEIETAKNLVSGSGALAGSTSITATIMAYLEAEAKGIGALCAIVTLVVYIFFQILQHIKLNKTDENKKDIDLILSRLDKVEKTDKEK